VTVGVPEVVALAPLPELLDRFGYLGIAALVLVESFGVPAPGQTAVVVGAAYARHGGGHLDVGWVAVVAFLSAVVGDNLGYLIGRRGGRPLILRYGRYVRLTPDRLARVERFMSRYGRVVVAFARFVDGPRQLNGLLAGATRMPWPRFVAFDTVGAAAWVGVWTTAGALAGGHLAVVQATLLRYRWYAVTAVVLAVVGHRVWLRRRRRSRADDTGADRSPGTADR
jgi:membrane protein DedA with SNARE-associated domain